MLIVEANLPVACMGVGAQIFLSLMHNILEFMRNSMIVYVPPVCNKLVLGNLT